MSEMQTSTLPTEMSRAKLCRGFAREILMRGLYKPSPRRRDDKTLMTWRECGERLYGKAELTEALLHHIWDDVDAAMPRDQVFSINELATVMELETDVDWEDATMKAELLTMLVGCPRFQKAGPRFCSVVDAVVQAVFKRIE